jgi:CheY-like chemotaxis protein
MNQKPLILCVDDEVNVLEGMKINLRKMGQILTAESGVEGLRVLKDHPDIAIVISDMRMPEMDGARFLSTVREQFVDTVRLLLTGFSDIDAAIRAVNEGQLFRFLTKPCPPDMLQAAVNAALDQHRLIMAERELLQRTLLGSVHALIQVMALDNPQAIGRAMRVRRRVRDIARSIGLRTVWPVEFAAIFSQLGIVSLRGELRKKIYWGTELEDDEQLALSHSIDAIVRVVGKIPRLEPAIAILRPMSAPATADDAVEVRIIRAAILLESAEAQGLTSEDAATFLRGFGDKIGADVLDACSGKKDLATPRMSIRAVALSKLAEGMVLACDLCTSEDILLVPRGLKLNGSTLQHIRNFAEKISVDFVQVEVCDPGREQG